MGESKPNTSSMHCWLQKLLLSKSGVHSNAYIEGSIEVDGAFLTKFWISDNDDSFADQIYMLKKKLDKHHEQHPKGWQVHVMILGAQKRGDSCPLLAFLTPVVTRNGERPPTESLRHIAKSPKKQEKLHLRRWQSRMGNPVWRTGFGA